MSDESGNWFGYAALLVWPLIALIFYRIKPLSEATIWTVLGALLFLPANVAIKFPMVPAIDKNLVASLSAFVGCMVLGSRDSSLVKRAWIVTMLACTYIVSPIFTSAQNNDPMVIGNAMIPGVGYYDGISAVISQTIGFLPLFVGRRYLRTPNDIETILRVLVLGGLIYSVLMLFEIRMSPQLSHWIYGGSFSFGIEARYGGFRPVVFMINGLAASFFLSTSVIACVALWRTRTLVVRLPGLAALYLGAVLLLCKSSGAMIYAAATSVLLRWAGPLTQVRVAILLGLLVFSYPVLSMAGLFPHRQLVEAAAFFSPERAQSLGFRFEQEDQLLAHASERFWLGWGRYGRNRIYDEYGKDISVTDGQWILTFGELGFIGFFAQFGLLIWPIFRSLACVKAVRHWREAAHFSCLSLLVAITAVEQLPNASLSPWSWLLAGALLGRSEHAIELARILKQRIAIRPAPRITGRQPLLFTADDRRQLNPK